MIAEWAAERGHTLTTTELHAGESLPNVESFDFLVIMGGPMNIYEEAKYPWLGAEKEFIRESISAGKRVIGICLGAQLIADVLGGKVTPGTHKEIGWFPVELTAEGRMNPLFGHLPPVFTAFHWHGDTFAIPNGAIHLATSEACNNQAFLFNDHVVALQFHIESTRESIQALIDNCRDELVGGMYIQGEEQMIQEETSYVAENRTALYGLLDRIAERRIDTFSGNG